jgi:hypothetical protein
MEVALGVSKKAKEKERRKREPELAASNARAGL